MEKIESEIPPIFLYQIEPILQEIISKIAIFIFFSYVAETSLTFFSADLHLFLSWKLVGRFEHGNGYDSVNVFGLNRSATLLLLNCCCCRFVLLLQIKNRNLLLPIRCCEYLRPTAGTQIANKLTHSRSIQVELGRVEGFSNSEIMLQTSLVNANQPFQCKAVNSLVGYATWTKLLQPSSLILYISSVCINDPSACAI